MTTTTAQTPTLSASDRCDACGARAAVRVALAAGELLFCKHHFEKSEAALRAQAFAITDERALQPK